MRPTERGAGGEVALAGAAGKAERTDILAEHIEVGKQVERKACEIRLRAERLCVIARGKVVAERDRQPARLSIEGRPATVTRRHARPHTGEAGTAQGSASAPPPHSPGALTS